MEFGNPFLIWPVVFPQNASEEHGTRVRKSLNIVQSSEAFAEETILQMKQIFVNIYT